MGLQPPGSKRPRALDPSKLVKRDHSPLSATDLNNINNVLSNHTTEAQRQQTDELYPDILRYVSNLVRGCEATFGYSSEPGVHYKAIPYVRGPKASVSRDLNLVSGLFCSSPGAP
jgi:hypothetical protein